MAVMTSIYVFLHNLEKLNVDCIIIDYASPTFISITEIVVS